MKILLNGCSGFMGREIVRLCTEGYRGASLLLGIDPNASDCDYPVYPSAFEADATGADVIIDFSHHSAAPDICALAVREGLPIVVATTGHTEAELAAIREAALSVPVFFASNMSLGVALLCEIARGAVAAMPDADVEIIETHHTRKLDAPSGTALTIAKELCEVRPEAYISTGRSGRCPRDKNEIGIQSVRVGNVVGIHEVIIGTAAQTITLKHEAHSRSLFAEGAIAAAAFILDAPAGLYDMKSLVGKKTESAVM